MECGNLALNSLNRSMGMKDAYPFVLSPQVLGKLRFVHELIQRQHEDALHGCGRLTSAGGADGFPNADVAGLFPAAAAGSRRPRANKPAGDLP